MRLERGLSNNRNCYSLLFNDLGYEVMSVLDERRNILEAIPFVGLYHLVSSKPGGDLERVGQREHPFGVYGVHLLHKLENIG